MTRRLNGSVVALAAAAVTLSALTGCAKKALVVAAQPLPAPCPAPPAPPAPAPAPPAAPVAHEAIVLPGELQFSLDSAHIKNTAENVALLSKLAGIVAQNPHITKLRIEGHTDNIGSSTHNQGLSQERADAVVRWLVAHDVDRERLTAIGYGDTRPIAENDTAEHRKMNRRTEFHVQELDGKSVDSDASTPPPAPVAQQDAH